MWDTPGGFENYFRELGELADKCGLTYGSPDWMDDIARRYGLNPSSH
ncbi:hypothetical protein [Mycobacterium interjectum]|nr:hypothetical protein [Mycobacterium interjectum]